MCSSVFCLFLLPAALVSEPGFVPAALLVGEGAQMSGRGHRSHKRRRGTCALLALVPVWAACCPCSRAERVPWRPGGAVTSHCISRDLGTSAEEDTAGILTLTSLQGR